MYYRDAAKRELDEALEMLKARGYLASIVALDGEGNIFYRTCMDDLSSVAVLARACAEVSWRRIWSHGSGESVFNPPNKED